MHTSLSKIFSIIVLLLPFLAEAQFNNITEQIGEHYTTTGAPNGNGLSFYDFNQDGWDDLTISMGNNPTLFFENQNGVYTPANFSIPHSGVGNIMMLLWADYDNDGDEDLLITKRQGPIELWNNDGSFNFTNVATEAGFMVGNYNHVGAAFADYNHDGCLDVYIAKYYHCDFDIGEQYEGKLYQNNCDGTFTDVTIATGVQMCAHYTFQPCFLDYNKDGWEDLYLVNDFPFFQNYLFKNNGDNTFQDVSALSGLDVEIDAMSSTVGDFNNDLLLDIFISNRPNTGGNNLMVNQGDETYQNQASALGLGTSFQSWGAVWLDENNDSWEDLFVTVPVPNVEAVGNEFYINNQGESFSVGRDLLGFGEDFTKSYVCAKGDVNNDGYFDLAVNNWYTSPFQLHQNSTGSNNWLSMTFQGTLSNRNGVGTWVNCYAGDKQWTRHTLQGENFMSQNSGKQIFGLGEEELIDSLVINWNVGTQEVYYNVSVNQHLHFIEGQTFTVPFQIEHEDDLYLCEEESLLLDAGEFETYVWNTGDTTRLLSANSPGVYFVSTTNQFGLTAQSYDLEVEAAPINETEIEINDISCFGANDGAISVAMSNTPLQSFQWNIGSTDLVISNLEEGAYSFIGVDSFGCSFFGNSFVEEPIPINCQVSETSPSCFGSEDGSIELSISGGTEPYVIDWNGTDPYAVGAGEYSFIISDFNNCFAQVPVIVDDPDVLVATISTTNVLNVSTLGTATIEGINGGTPPYQIEWSNGVLNELSVGNLLSGQYSVVIEDANGCVKTFNFTIGNSVGINENNASGMSVYPNPFTNQITIEGCENNFDWILYSSNGSEIDRASNQNCKMPLIFNDLLPGLYLLEVRSNIVAKIKLIKLP